LRLNAIAAADVFLDEPEDVRLSWLPMSHALARTGDLYTALVRGGCLNVVADRRRVLDACRAAPPTVVLGVPAFFERLERAIATGAVADLAAALGGRVRVCVSGAAPLRQRTVDAFAERGVPLVQGYGLAEAGPVVALANPRTARPGTVGPPLAGVEVRIDQRPESRGQLLVRTPSRALGVLLPPESEAAAGRDAAATAVELPEWMPTGDLAAIDADGHVRITGRIVDTLVLAGGTKVPPAELERGAGLRRRRRAGCAGGPPRPRARGTPPRPATDGRPCLQPPLRPDASPRSRLGRPPRRAAATGAPAPVAGAAGRARRPRVRRRPR
jgi:long-chain acyl-CoA synthetase